MTNNNNTELANQQQFSVTITEYLKVIRGFQHPALLSICLKSTSIPAVLLAIATQTEALGRLAEAEALNQAYDKITTSPNFGGLGFDNQKPFTKSNCQDALLVIESWLESLKSAERVQRPPTPTSNHDETVKPMTLAEKIFAHHAVEGCSSHGIKAGDVIRTNIDWILASELSWQAMARTHEELGSPGIWRNDRFWLAGDHVVHPKVQTNPKIKAMINAAEKAKKDFKMTEYQGMNYTIMHTEFVRERAEPGMLVLGSDSHTCSAGAVGCLSIGLGTADVMMALSLGETWFKIPESIRIEFVGQPAVGMTGKDVVLYILKELKRNTVAAERIVEFVGEGLQHLSCDARFAIANMCTEFGAVSGVFEPDRITQAYIARRKRKANKTNSVFFRADDDAEYAGKYTIDLSKVEASVAVYPEPDNVVPVSEMANTKLDGVFIGACTTTEEDLVMAALVLKVGLAKGLPLAKGKRHYVPGSLPIVEKLRSLGLLDVYEAAGFTRGPPGCSYCVGLSAEKASEGETWLSSQNRNFRNRMGKGAFGHITSAVVCAASSFGLSITDPAPFLEEIDTEFWDNYRGGHIDPHSLVRYVEPSFGKELPNKSGSQQSTNILDDQNPPLTNISSRVVTLEDFIDTDALAPGSTLTTCTTDAEFGQHVLENTHPDFRNKVKSGQKIVVAGHAFGVGSSREVAVSALKGAGVQAVIAKSFAFIYGRNQPSLGLLGFTVSDDNFFTAATDGAEISIDVPSRTVTVENKTFSFSLSEIEYNLTVNQGITQAYQKFGKGIWSAMAEKSGLEEKGKNVSDVIRDAESIQPKASKLDW